MRLGRLWGVEVRASPFFFLLLALLLWTGRIWEVGIYLLTLGAHEGAHLYLARTQGLGRGELELWPLGGVTRLEDLSGAEPTAEALVALAGPVGNLALLAFAILLREHGLLGPWPWQLLYTANLGMAFLNLLPVFPLDGGRLYRAILVPERGWAEATRRAIRLGRALSAAFLLGGAAGLFLGLWGPVWPLFGLFLWLTGRSEADPLSYRFYSGLLAGRGPVGAQAATVLVARPETTLGEVVRQFRPRRYHLVDVVDAEGRLLLRLSQDQLTSALVDLGPGAGLDRLLGRR